MKNASVRDIVNSINTIDLKIAFGDEYCDKKNITFAGIQRPGLALAKHFSHIESGCVELLGDTELSYLLSHDLKYRTEVLDKIASINKTAFAVAKGLEIPEELINVAKKYNIPILSSEDNTRKVDNEISHYLENKLAPEIHMHGVCLEIFGLGVVIIGRSGIGKSECALELIKKGHRLVADDIIHIIRKRVNLIASSDKLLRNHIELRGIGILNLAQMFGVGSVCTSKNIDLVIEFLDYNVWHNRDDIDRLGLGNYTKNILGVDIPTIFCPVSLGRNMAEIVELATKNHLLKIMGYDSTREFSNSVNKHMLENSEDLEFI